MKIIKAFLYTDNTPVLLEIADGIIRKVEPIAHIQAAEDNLYIAPGLFDNQVNGYLGVEFTSAELTTEKVRKVVRGLWKTGVTTFLPTVITASYEKLLKAFTGLAKAMHDPEIARSVPGFHLEGPYISPQEGFRGAHNPAHIRLPDWDEFQKLNEAAEGKILQITLAPEVDGAIDFIKKCTKQGVVVALGHHNASADEIKKAVDAGAKTVTHLGNGCANTIHRFNNPFWMQLAEDRLMASLIVDGVHLPPEQVKVFYRSKGSERLILTSDITMLAGMQPGNYNWDGKTVVLRQDGSIRYPQGNSFAGASLPLLAGINNMMRFTNCTLKEAVNMASQNPARLYGLGDRGVIKVGKRADLILFQMEGNQLRIKKTVVAGEILYDASLPDILNKSEF